MCQGFIFFSFMTMLIIACDGEFSMGPAAISIYVITGILHLIWHIGDRLENIDTRNGDHEVKLGISKADKIDNDSKDKPNNGSIQAQKEENAGGQ